MSNGISFNEMCSGHNEEVITKWCYSIPLEEWNKMNKSEKSAALQNNKYQRRPYTGKSDDPCQNIKTVYSVNKGIKLSEEGWEKTKNATKCPYQGTIIGVKVDKESELNKVIRPAYTLGTSTRCPNGYKDITSSNECNTVFSNNTFKGAWQGSGSFSKGVPTGCSTYNKDGYAASFNTYSTPTQVDTSVLKVCKLKS